MHYDLGVGLGGSTTTAAVLRGAAAGHPEVVLSEPVAAGDPAARGALDRVGDPVPLLTARGPRAGADLVAATVGCVVQRATVSEGGAPRAIAVTRPASWGAHRDRALTEALARAGLDDVLLVPDADAAVDAAPAVRTGELVGVLDLGARSTSAVLVRRLRGRRGLRVTEPVGTAARPVPVGGTDVDDAVLDHVRDAIGGLPAADDRETRRALAELRRRCVGAKEALATRDEVVIDADLPGHRVRVPLTRTDLDARVAPLVERAALALRELAGAGSVDAVVLVGGTARLPLVADAVGTALGVDVRPQPDPGTLLACGAARAAGVHAARRRRAARGDRAPRTTPTPVAADLDVPAPLRKIAPGAPARVPDEHGGAAPPITAGPDPDPGAEAVEAGRRPGADVPRPPVTVAPVPDEVRSTRAPRGRARLVLATAAIVVALGAAAATIPVPGLTRGATSSPLPVARTAPAGAATPSLAPPGAGTPPAVRSATP